MWQFELRFGIAFQYLKEEVDTCRGLLLLETLRHGLTSLDVLSS
jgi:hypothetical protein